MRLLTTWALAAALLSAVGSWPSGCTSDPPVAQPPELSIQTADPESVVPAGGVSVRATDDPLVPPIPLEAEPLLPPAAPVQRIAAVFAPAAHGLPDFSSDLRAQFHPHGHQVCASGCAASNHPTPELSREAFRELMARYAYESPDETSLALETLLYYGRQTAEWIRQEGYIGLDRQRAELLSRELRRTHGRISFRLVDAAGAVRVNMPATRVPFDRRHVFEMDEQDLPDLVTSGTVKRVGLHHLWTRL